MKYRLGFGATKGADWKARELSPAQGFRSILKLLTFTILALALAGSMQSAIEAQTTTDDGINQAWHNAVGNILFESSLSEMVTWLGGFAFALTAVLGAQALTRYIAILAVDAEQSMEADQNQLENPYTIEIDRVGAMTALAIVNAKLEKKADKAKSSHEWSNPTDFLEPMIHQNGNGNHRDGA